MKTKSKAALLKAILPKPAGKIVKNRFAKGTQAAACMAKCSGKCRGG